jgi:hypothetical protein
MFDMKSFRRLVEREDEVWRACLSEPDYQTLLRENDVYVTELLIRELSEEKARQECLVQEFHKHLTFEDFLWLQEIYIGVR